MSKVPRLFGGVPRKARGSFEFRRHESLVSEGKVTPKYSRILPFVPGNTVFEMGAAEGVLSLLLAEKKEKVWAVERSFERHTRAKQLQEQWLKLGFSVESCEMVFGSVTEHLQLLDDSETFLAVRAIYYLGSDVEDVVAQAWRNVENVVLVGNGSRSQEYFGSRVSRPQTARPSGGDNYLATLDGMWSLVSRHGLEVRHAVPDGDPIIVATRKRH